MRRESIVSICLLVVVCPLTPLFGQLPTGWTGRDIGTPGAAGSIQYDKATGAWTIRGDGTGIRGQSDQFYFVYKTLIGDGELTARVASLEPPLADWAMAGVMIRMVLIPESPYIFMGISANTDTQDHGITFWGRETPGGPADHDSTGPMIAPYWVRVRRTGNTFSGFTSPDGKDWTLRYSADSPGVPPSIYIGYAVSSETAGKLHLGPVWSFTTVGPEIGVQVRYFRGIDLTGDPIVTRVEASIDHSWAGGEVAGGLSNQVSARWTADLQAPFTATYQLTAASDDGVRLWLDDQRLINRWTTGNSTDIVRVDLIAGQFYRLQMEWCENTGTATAGIYRSQQALDAATFDPGPLEWGKTYYWRVDEVNPADAGSPWTGAVWSFTTAAFLVVEDFESCTNEEGNRIYQIWIDGEINHTGALVGHADAPFAEQKVVHGGRQSLPMDYNNVQSPWYSESQREWPTPQDWTVRGGNTLVLHLRGTAANTPGPFYVAVEDKAGHVAVVTHPDAALVTTMQWTEWKIPLATLSGAGRVYLDDIRVIKPGECPAWRNRGHGILRLGA